jgi:hypothetical protein
MENEESSAIMKARENLKEKGKQVSKCMLEQFYGTTLGVAVGLIFGVRQRNLRPFVVGVTFGTLGDFIYGYSTGCRTVFEDFKRAESQLKLEELSKQQYKK